VVAFLSEKQIKRGNKTCSRSCANQFRYRNVQKYFVCQNCGVLFKKKYPGKKQGKKYCSQQCAIYVNSRLPKSDSHKRKIAKGQKNVRKEGLYTCERCGKQFNANTSLRAHKASCGHKKRIVMCYRCNRKFRGLAALRLHESYCDVNSEWGKNRCNAIMANILKGFNGANTDIELVFKMELDRRKIRYIHQYFYMGHPYDFLLRDYDVLVEADGDWWHGRDLSQKMPFQVKARVKDVEITRQALKGGYGIVRYWGTDLLTKCSKCVDEMISFANGYIGKTKIARVAERVEV